MLCRLASCAGVEMLRKEPTVRASPHRRNLILPIIPNTFDLSALRSKLHSLATDNARRTSCPLRRECDSVPVQPHAFRFANKHIVLSALHSVRLAEIQSKDTRLAPWLRRAATNHLDLMMLPRPESFSFVIPAEAQLNRTLQDQQRLDVGSVFLGSVPRQREGPGLVRHALQRTSATLVERSPSILWTEGPWSAHRLRIPRASCLLGLWYHFVCRSGVRTPSASGRQRR